MSSVTTPCVREGASTPRDLRGGRVCPLTVTPSPRRAAALPDRARAPARAITDNAAHEVPPCRPRRAGRREPARERGGSAAQLAGEADGGTAVPRFLGRARPVAGRQRLGLLRRRRLRPALLEPRRGQPRQRLAAQGR